MRSKTEAVSYLRVSGKGQVKGDGFPRQRQAINRYAKSHRLEVVEEFRDEGVSGTTSFGDRPGLSALIERILSNGVRTVLVEQASRLARDLIEGELILRELRENNVKVIAADSAADLTVGSDDPTSKLIRQVLGAVSEFEKSTIVSKLRAARRRIRAREGRCEGRKPFGYYEGEDEVLREMKRLHRKNPRTGKRKSYGEIANALNEAGMSSRTGKSWSRGSVFAILTRK